MSFESSDASSLPTGTRVLIASNFNDVVVACVGVEVDLLNIPLEANTYSYIMVECYGRFSNVNDAGEDPTSYNIKIRIGANVQQITHNPLRATAAQVSDNSGDWYWSFFYLVAQQAADTIRITADHNGTDSQTANLQGYAIWGIV